MFFNFKLPNPTTKQLDRYTIHCTLEFARFLVRTGKVLYGVWETPTNKIYL
jgi:nitrite reductase/ring-hydroxylating ferredoxin subunit